MRCDGFVLSIRSNVECWSAFLRVLFVDVSSSPEKLGNQPHGTIDMHDMLERNAVLQPALKGSQTATEFVQNRGSKKFREWIQRLIILL
jgi:hypothetical protein